jgi:uncharacterized protein (UPF0333 family)
MKSSKGQVVIEYVLLLIVAVVVAILITQFMVSRNPDEPGVVVNKWNKINRAIGDDKNH